MGEPVSFKSKWRKLEEGTWQDGPLTFTFASKCACTTEHIHTCIHTCARTQTHTHTNARTEGNKTFSILAAMTNDATLAFGYRSEHLRRLAGVVMATETSWTSSLPSVQSQTPNPTTHGSLGPTGKSVEFQDTDSFKDLLSPVDSRLPETRWCSVPRLTSSCCAWSPSNNILINL